MKRTCTSVVLDEEIIDQLFARAPSGLSLSVDLEQLTVSDGDAVHRFTLPPPLREKLLEGMDDIAQTLAERELIEAFETRHRTAQPWLFNR